MVSELYLNLIPEVLCSMSNLNEILWNFRRPEHKKGRLTLKQNPHFYEVLPTSPERYGGGFEMMPTDKYLHGKIDVLTDNSGQAGRVFLKTAKKTRAFGNAWDLKNAIIFKGSWLPFFKSFSHLLTFSQTSVESLREKESSEKPSKTHPTYGALGNFRRLTPLHRPLHRIGVAHRRPRPQHRRLAQKGYY
jgi:hypothetical protein